MAKKEPQLPSEIYHARALDAFKGMAWMGGLAFVIFPSGHRAVSIAIILFVIAAICMAIGCTMYVFAHKARMLEAEDMTKSLPKKAAEA